MLSVSSVYYVMCVTEQTPIQQELSSANDRFNALAQRATSVKKNRQAVADCVQDIVELQARLDERRRSMPHIRPVPIVEAEVRDKLKQIVAYHKDLLANESRVIGVTSKAEQLLQGREHAPETKALRRQLRKLGKLVICLSFLARLEYCVANGEP